MRKKILQANDGNQKKKKKNKRDKRESKKTQVGRHKSNNERSTQRKRR